MFAPLFKKEVECVTLKSEISGSVALILITAAFTAF